MGSDNIARQYLLPLDRAAQTLTRARRQLEYALEREAEGIRSAVVMVKNARAAVEKAEARLSVIKAREAVAP